MEIKNRLILKHTSGLYLSWSIEDYPLTRKLTHARAFHRAEDIASFLESSFYKPDRPEDFEILEMEIEYRLKGVEPDVQ